MWFTTYSPAQGGVLVVLLAAWAALLFGGFLGGHLNAERTRRMPAWTRLGSSLVLVIAAWAGFFFNGGQTAPVPFLVAVGMTCGFCGDLFMAGIIRVGHRVLPGMAAFGMGHIAYIAGIVIFSNQYGYDMPVARWGALLFWLVVGVAGWCLVVFRGRRPTVLHWAALPYTLLLASTAGCATGLALQVPGFLPLALGAILFLLSDLILAARLFNNACFYLIEDAIWLTYGPAQMLIVYSWLLVPVARL